MELISLIVPVYNVEKYIDKCISSLINQSYKNIEIILVNDGSTDRSYDICKKYTDLDKRIKLINKENGGLSDARNKGIDNARGEYIVFIDSDDWIDHNMIDKMYKLATKYNADIVQTSYANVYNEDTYIDNSNKKENISIYNEDEILNNLYNLENKANIKTVIVWNKIYKKELFNEIRFPKGKIHEDEFTTYKLLHKANLIVDTDIPLYYYRQREGSIMNSKFNIKRLDALDAFIERKKYFSEYNFNYLENKTDEFLCRMLKKFYVEVIDSEIHNKQNVLKRLKKEMKSRYFNFMFNKEISTIGKITLTLCILNGKLFYKLYDKSNN